MVRVDIDFGLGSFRVSSLIVSTGPSSRMDDFKRQVAKGLCLDHESFYLTYNGKILQDLPMMTDNETIPVIAVPRLLGGKGGFGSMLRAIGAQIEKTTNRDACRDLSGRRLRDINEEQRLKRWFARQKERDEEKADNKKKRLEKLRKICEGPPLPIMDDEQYNQQRADMPQSVFDAVDKGLEVASSSKSVKAQSSIATSSSSGSAEESDQIETKDTTEKPDVKKEMVGRTEKKTPVKLKKTMWDEDLDSGTSSSDSDDEVPQKKAKLT